MVILFSDFNSGFGKKLGIVVCVVGDMHFLYF